MTRHIDILLSGPPSIDFPSFVCVQDETGEPVTLGQWIGPDDSSPFWRYRLTPAELLLHMIAETQELTGQAMPTVAAPSIQPQRTQTQEIVAVASAGQSARANLRKRLATTPLRTGQAPAPMLMADPLATEKCPACHALFNPALHQLVDCMLCGESKCTDKCIPNSAAPCLDCQALSADPEDGGFDPNAGPPQAEIRSPVLRAKLEQLRGEAAVLTAGRLFDNAFHGKGGEESKEDNDDE